MKDKTKLIKAITEELLEKLLIKAKVKVEEKEDVYEIKIESDDSGFLIGYHGETIEALQLILSLAVNRKLNQGDEKEEAGWVKLTVDVGDYREKRLEQLTKLAMNVAQKVKFSNEAQAISGLSASERRLVHLALTDHPDVSTESEGEGKERRLVVKPKKNK